MVAHPFRGQLYGEVRHLTSAKPGCVAKANMSHDIEKKNSQLKQSKTGTDVDK